MRVPLASVVAAFAGSVGCAPRGVGAFWRPGAVYELTLVAAGPRTLTPERAAYLAPVRDTAVVRLTADSVAHDSVYGRLEGDTRHFPVMFRALGGDRFVATRDRERWRVRLNPHATDTGLLLVGELSHGRLRGAWETPEASPDHGTFEVAPAT